MVGGWGGVISQSLIFRPLTFSTRPPRCPIPADGQSGTMQLPVTSSPVRSRREKFRLLLHTSSRLFPSHFTLKRRGNAESWSSTSWLLAGSDLLPLFPPNASFCSADQALSVRRRALLPGQTKEPRKRDRLALRFYALPLADTEFWRRCRRHT